MKLKQILSPSTYRPYRRVKHPLLGFSKKEFVFIHINKCGGSSIIKSMWPVHKWHDTVKEIIDIIGVEKYNSTYKFTVVRNPWSKVVSQYNYRIQTQQNDLAKIKISFKEWLFKTYGEHKDANLYDTAKMFQTQLWWLKDNEGQVNLNQIIRLESLNSDFEKVSKDLGIKKQIPHRNKSKAVDYKAYYDEESKKLVATFFREDIEYLGYQFNS